MEENIKEKVNCIYNYPFNELKTSKEYAPVITSIINILKKNKEPISIQSALNILDDCKMVIKEITQV